MPCCISWPARPPVPVRINRPAITAPTGATCAPVEKRPSLALFCLETGIRMPDRFATAEGSALLRSVLETVPDAMVVIDSHGHILLFSTAAERLFGYTSEEVDGKNVSMLMPSPYREAHDSYL